MNKYSKTAARVVFAVIVVFVVCFSLHTVYFSANAGEKINASQSNNDESNLAADKEDEIECETGLAIQNEEMEKYDGYIVKSKEYQIDSEEDAAKFKSYMKEEAENGEAYSVK